MILDIFKKEDPSGMMSRESYISKKHKKEYEYIVNYCELNKISDIPFKEKVYLCLNLIKSRPTCKKNSCNNFVKFINSNIGYREYCSTKCVSSDPNIKKSKEEKSLKKWGTKTPAESNEIKNKIINTNRKKYGENSPMCLKEIQKKSKTTLLKKFGVDNASKSSKLLEKRIESFKKSNYKETYKETSLKRYGVEHPWMNKEIHKKTIDVFYKDYKERIINKIDTNLYEFISFEKNLSTELKFKCKKCDENFKILPYQFYYRINNNLSICTRCFPISENSSISEIELFEFIEENYKGMILRNNKNIIKPYEIDVYIPELNIGFEFNGVFWHSDKFKDDKYHYKKNKLSLENNIKLYTIWEDDWNTKKDICKSFILNKLKKSKVKIGARKTKVKKVNYLESKKFLSENHLQGDVKSSIRLGLYKNNELITIMTFSKLRLPLNRKLKNDIGVYELTRFCNKIEHNIVGGASKLLKYFINNYNPTEIQTYSDNLISEGDLYKNLGFNYIHESKPGYWYVINGIREHRFNWRKQKLVEMGHDKEKTENEIMMELGFYRIYNAGNKKWTLTI